MLILVPSWEKLGVDKYQFVIYFHYLNPIQYHRDTACNIVKHTSATGPSMMVHHTYNKYDNN